jgi:cell division protein FtsB
MDIRVERISRIRIRPEDGLRAVVDRAPQAEEALDRLAERFRPTWTKMYRLRRRIGTCTVLVLTLLLGLHVVFGANGWVVFRQRRTEIDSLQREVNGLQLQNQQFTDQIKSLKSDKKAIEKEAREQLHYARPGEIVYVSPPPVNPQKPATNSAKK